MGRAVLFVICCAVLVGPLVGSASGQRYQGGLRGTIADATGVIPAATVQLIEVATSVLRTTISNERGAYVLRT